MEAAVGQPTPQDRQQSVGQVVNFPTPQDRDSLTVRQLADAYGITYKGRDHAKLARVEWWCSKIGDTKVVDLDADRIADLLDEFAAEPVQRFKGKDENGNKVLTAHGPRKPATVNRQKAALASLITYAKDHRLLPRGFASPLRDVPGRRENNAKTRYLTLAEQDRLLKLALVSSWRKMHLFVLMALHTGARKQELLNLLGGDLDLEQRTALVRRTKTGKQKVLTLTKAVVDEIKKRGVPKSDQLLFPSKRKTKEPRPFEVQKMFERLVRDAGLVTKDKPDPVTIHTLRHSFASTLAQRGVSLVAIADALGHSSAATVTKRYSHLSTESRQRMIDEAFG
jgi:integrase